MGRPLVVLQGKEVGQFPKLVVRVSCDGEIGKLGRWQAKRRFPNLALRKAARKLRKPLTSR